LDRCGRVDSETAAGAARKRRQQSLQHLTQDSAADRSRDRVAEHAEAIVLERCTGCVAADRASQQLDNQIDQAFCHERLQSLARLFANACALRRAHAEDYGGDELKIDWTEVQCRAGAGALRLVLQREKLRREARRGVGGRGKRASRQ